MVRPEASLIYVNAATVLDAIQSRLRGSGISGIRLIDLRSVASPFIDPAGSRMQHELQAEFAERGIALRSAAMCAISCGPTVLVIKSAVSIALRRSAT